MNQKALIEKIYTEHFGLFIHIGKKTYGLHIETVKDVIHDTFLKVLTHNAEKPDDELGMRAYLKTAFKNKCLDKLCRPNVFVSYTSGDDSPSHMNHENVADLNSLQEVLFFEELLLRDACIEKLPVKYQAPVKLRLEGEALKDIAQKLKIRESSIHNLVYRGLKKFQKIMNKLEF